MTYQLHYINPNYFIKGKSDKNNNKQFSRIYVDTIQVLYEGATSRSHKNLGYIMKLLPKMNYKTNFIVHNPDEDNVFNLQPYSLIEICKELNMSTDKSNMRKFYKYNREINGYEPIEEPECLKHIDFCGIG